MYAPTFNIMIRLTDGTVLKAFTWCRGERQGIDRALREGAEWDTPSRSAGLSQSNWRGRKPISFSNRGNYNGRILSKRHPAFVCRKSYA